MQETWHTCMCHPEGLPVPEVMGSFACLFYNKKKKDCLTLCFKVFFLFPPHDSDAFQAFQMPSHTRTQSTSTEAKDMLKTRKRRHQR